MWAWYLLGIGGAIFVFIEIVLYLEERDKAKFREQINKEYPEDEI